MMAHSEGSEYQLMGKDLNGELDIEATVADSRQSSEDSFEYDPLIFPNTESEFFNCIKHGYIQQVKTMIDQGHDPSCRDLKGRPALHVAITSNRIDIVKLLLDNNVDCDGTNYEGETALMCAIRSNQLDTVKMLVDRNADCYKRDACGHNVLYHAIMANNNEAVQHLLIKNIDCNQKDEDGNTEFHHAQAYGVELSIVRLLLPKVHNINAKNKFDETALHLAAKPFDDANNRFTIDPQKIALLLQAKADVNMIDAHGSSVLLNVCQAFEESSKDDEAMYHDTVKNLLSHGASESINAVGGGGLTALICVRQSKLLLDCLISNGAAIQDNIFFRMRNLKFSEYQDVYEYLHGKGADPFVLGTEGETLVHAAAEYADPDALQWFASLGVDVNKADDFKRTALHRLFFHKREFTHRKKIFFPKKDSQIIKFCSVLLQNGVDINLCDLNKQPALHYATLTAPEDCIRMLLAKGASPSTEDKCGLKPLHLAAWLNDNSHFNHASRVMNLLMENDGPGLFCKDIFGSTPLYHALYNCNPVTATFLLDKMRKNADLYAEIDEWFKSNQSAAAVLQAGDITIGMITSLTDTRPIRYPPFISEEEFFPFNCESKGEKEYIEWVQDNVGFRPDDEQFIAELIKKSSPLTNKYSDENEVIQSQVNEVVHRLCSKMAKMDQRFQITPILSGSVSERTKIMNFDEFDFLFCLDELKNNIRIIELDHIPGFAELKCEDSQWKEFFESEDSKVHIARKICKKMYKLIYKASLEADIWEGTYIYPLNTLSNDSFRHDSISSLKLMWVGPTIKGLEIKMDIVAAVRPPPNWKPSSMTSAKENFIKNNIFCSTSNRTRSLLEYLIILKENIHYNETTMRISFSLIESRIFQSVPDVVRKGYILAKIMRHPIICPGIHDNENDFQSGEEPKSYEDCIETYALKHALFHLYDDIKFYEDTPGNVRKITQMIYQYLKDNQHRIGSYFIEEYEISMGIYSELPCHRIITFVSDNRDFL